MPPRKTNTLTVEPWPPLKTGRLCQAKVKNVRLEKAATCLHVTIENLDPGQLGRIHEMDLPLPVRPGNRTCLFLVACGIEATTAGATICVDHITNATVGIKFLGLDAKGVDNFAFEKVSGPFAGTTASAHKSREQGQDDAG